MTASEVRLLEAVQEAAFLLRLQATVEEVPDSACAHAAMDLEEAFEAVRRKTNHKGRTALPEPAAE